MKTSQAKKWSGMGLRISVPITNTRHNMMSLYHKTCEPHTLPPDIYEHKEYPVCKCGRKFVPINKGDTECFFCNFSDINKRKVNTNKCHICSKQTYDLIKTKEKNLICKDCEKDRANARDRKKYQEARMAIELMKK